jgi:hypothetical protein
LIVRGGINELATLRTAYAAVTLIDTRAFMKAQKRQRAAIIDGTLDWEPSPTAVGASIDELLDTNIAAVALTSAP